MITLPARRALAAGAVAAMLSSLLLAGCGADTSRGADRPGAAARPASAEPAAPPAGAGMPALTTAQLVRRLLKPNELGAGYTFFGTARTGDDQPAGFRTLKPGSAACRDAMASFASNPRVGRLSARQFASRGLADPATRAAVNEWVGSFSDSAQAEVAMKNLLRDVEACPTATATVTSPTPAVTFTLTRLSAPRYGDQSAELLTKTVGVADADPVLIVRYGANLMALTIDTPHDRDAVVAAAATAADKRFTG